MINKVKENKKLKAALFFGFYFFFFLFIFICIGNSKMSSNKSDANKKTEESGEINRYSIKYLMDNDYKYTFSIEDNDTKIDFNGTKDIIDYKEFDNKYFLDIFNVNQMIKNSKYLNNDANTLNYEINNDVLSNLVGVQKVEGISKIIVYVKDNGDLYKVVLDLSSFMQKDKYLITLNYEVGEDDD